MRRSLTVIALGTLALLYAKNSPAPPPPILNCASGVPASIALQYPIDVHGPINSELPYFQIQAFDSAGNPLANVPINVQAPATGPSASFYTSGPNYVLTPAPDPLRITVTTANNCQGGTVYSVANGIVGGFQFVASAGGTSNNLIVPATNTLPAPPASLTVDWPGSQGIAHIGSPFAPMSVSVRTADGFLIAGVPVVFTLPASGPSGTFREGTLSATVYSDAFGKAIAPDVIANSQVGSFHVTASAAGVASVKLGPFINAGTAQAFVQALDPDDPASALAGAPIMFGQTISIRASVVFPGLPVPSNQSPSGLPQPNGKVTVRVNGNVVAWTLFDQFYYLYACTACAQATFNFQFRVNAFPFGQSQLTVSYEADSAYDASSSAPETISVAPQSVIPTATAGQSSVGATGAYADAWSCRFESAAWVSAESAAPAEERRYSFPYGLLRYRLDQCSYHAPVFDFPPPLYQILALQLPAPLPPGTVFVNYGPTRDNATPHWYDIPVQIDGATIRVPLNDGGFGDDELATGGVIAGLGGPGLPAIAPTTIPVVEFYAASLDHYFISADAQEIAALDNQVIPGWTRTGFGFKAYPAGTSATSPVCRFYIPPESGDSHFFSASPTECAQTRQKFPTLVYESPDVFHVGLPDPATGNCAVGTIPVYRVWNNRSDSNHRYTTSRTLRDQMLAKGYLAEGYGADVVVMCAAQ